MAFARDVTEDAQSEHDSQCSPHLPRLLNYAGSFISLLWHIHFHRKCYLLPFRMCPTSSGICHPNTTTLVRTIIRSAAHDSSGWSPLLVIFPVFVVLFSTQQIIGQYEPYLNVSLLGFGPTETSVSLKRKKYNKPMWWAPLPNLLLAQASLAMLASLIVHEQTSTLLRATASCLSSTVSLFSQ